MSAYDPIGAALAEDIGSGDVTSLYFVPPAAEGWARIVAKEEAVVAGVDVAAEVFNRVDSSTRTRILTDNGAEVMVGDVVLEMEGTVRSILTAERVALNFLQQLSGVATLTRQFVRAVAHTRAVILDTRKTTPGLRLLEKVAVIAGGGQNHRIGLFDRAMVKDNHLVASGNFASLAGQIAHFKNDHPELAIELEADTLEQVKAFLVLKDVDYILLDNMSPLEMETAVQMSAGRVKLEASGGITLETVGRIAETGVDFISVGSLTHSAPAVDFSLDLQHA